MFEPKWRTIETKAWSDISTRLHGETEEHHGEYRKTKNSEQVHTLGWRIMKNWDGYMAQTKEYGNEHSWDDKVMQLFILYIFTAPICWRLANKHITELDSVDFSVEKEKKKPLLFAQLKHQTAADHKREKCTDQQQDQRLSEADHMLRDCISKREIKESVPSNN